MKKSISESKVQRMRNIVTKKYNNKTAVSTGYKKVKETFEEGDFWEQKGKTWTIKNGIKQNVPKLQKIRDIAMLPLSCPDCSGIMKKRLDKKFWKTHNKCFDCVLDSEHKIRINREWGSYQNTKVKANVKSFIIDLKQRLVDYINNIDNKHFITEAGDIEAWEGGYDKKYLKESFDKQIAEFEKKWEKNNNVK
jgi:hypothetical protein